MSARIKVVAPTAHKVIDAMMRVQAALPEALVTGEIERPTKPELEWRRDRHWRPTHQHRKRGTAYMVTALALLQTDQPAGDYTSLVLYRSKDGTHWARPFNEFHDGRFDEIRSSEGDP